MAKKWIADMQLKRGALREELHTPKGQNIPAAKLAAAAKKGGTLGKRARLAETFKKMRHG